MQGDFDRLKATIARAAMKRIVAARVYEGQRYFGRRRYPVDHLVQRHAVAPQDRLRGRAQISRCRHEIVALTKSIADGKAMAGKIEKSDIRPIFLPDKLRYR